jgi:hypothetical protein
MNALSGTALAAMGCEFAISRDGEPNPTSRATSDDHDPCWNETAMAVFSLVVDPLSILGFPGRLSGGMAIPHGALRTARDESLRSATPPPR